MEQQQNRHLPAWLNAGPGGPDDAGDNGLSEMQERGRRIREQSGSSIRGVLSGNSLDNLEQARQTGGQ